MFKQTFNYEFIPLGAMPSWSPSAVTPMKNPVHVGDKVKLQYGGNLLKIVEVEHYESGSVAYFSA